MSIERLLVVTILSGWAAFAHAAVGDGLLGEYFSNQNLSGSPDIAQIDPTVDFTWAWDGPIAGMPSEHFSVRWSGVIVPATTETYTFVTESDDGVRLWINGTLVIDNWTDHPPTENSGTFDLTAGVPVNVVVEYYENTQYSTIQLLWESASVWRQAVPSSVLGPPEGTGLAYAFYNNITLSGDPIATGVEPNVSHSWGTGSPMAGVNADNFSLLWVGSVQPVQSGSYTISTISDDGVRVWLGNQIIIDDWHGHPPQRNDATVWLEAWKKYPIRVEYYEGPVYAELDLLWTPPGGSESVIPTSRLFPSTIAAAQDYLIAAGHSYVSPACVEGGYSSELPTLATNSIPVTPLSLSNHRWYANVPLVTDEPNVVTADLASGTQQAQIAWDIIDLDSPAITTLSARVSDSIAVVSSQGNAIRVERPDGTITDVAASPGVRYLTFNAGGVWHVSAVGSWTGLVVTVFDGSFVVDPDKPLAVRLDDNYSIDLSAFSGLQPEAGSLIYRSEDSALTVSQSGSSINVVGLATGTRGASVRIGSENGPILAQIPLTCFQITGWEITDPVMPDGSPIPTYTPGGAEIVIFDDGNGVTRYKTTLTLTPYVPNLDITITKFAHESTFLGGATTFTVPTDGNSSSLGEAGFTTATVNGVTVGHFSYTLLSPNGAAATYCLMHSCETHASFLNHTTSYPLPAASFARRDSR